MCSIIGSFSKDKIKELAELNAYRGQHSHSVYVFSKFDSRLLYSHKGFGPLDIDKYEIPEGVYIICHQQAPTTDNKDYDSIHPAQIGKQLLWHNGIIKAHEIERLQEYLESTSTWDTKLLLQYLVNEEYNALQNIDGTFSCVWYNGRSLQIFRNEISPMFYDEHGNISSTKFKDSKSVDPNIVWMMNIDMKEFFKPEYRRSEFKTVNNPYYGL